MAKKPAINTRISDNKKAAYNYFFDERLEAGVVREGVEGPETIAMDEVHYMMQPYHALMLALGAEERAERFFARIAEAATVDSVRSAALELRAEEQEHVELIKAWLAKVPKPDRDWADDPDPPRYTD